MQLLESFDVEVREGYVVAARDPAGASWAAAREGSMSRLFSHALVMAAVALPMMVTAASAHSANAGGRVAARTAMIMPAATPEPSDRLLVVQAIAAARSDAMAPSPAPPAAPVLSGPSAERSRAVGGGGRFAFGWCTWYVSTRRFIPWMGNAIEWYANAAAMGFPEGSTPRVGAIMVTRESGWGHVAFVESVDADGRGWTVSEMNFRGFAVVSTRHIGSGEVPLVGFIQ
jgi:surface antigen